MSITIHIADDHTIFRSGLRAFIEKHDDLEVVGETGNGFDAISWFRENQADVLLLDISMPGMSGSGVARQLVQDHSETRILVLTMHDDEFYLREFFRIGCKGFILKSSPAELLVKGIRAVSAGEVFVDPALSKYLVASYAGPGAATAKDHDLTPREKEVCRVLAMGHTNEEAAQLLHISRRTVETHRAAIMAKLNLSSRAELVRFAMENDLLS
jgi:two-component system, NarL family, response regulator NreC